MNVLETFRTIKEQENNPGDYFWKPSKNITIIFFFLNVNIRMKTMRSTGLIVKWGGHIHTGLARPQVEVMGIVGGVM